MGLVVCHKPGTSCTEGCCTKAYCQIDVPVPIPPVRCPLKPNTIKLTHTEEYFAYASIPNAAKRARRIAGLADPNARGLNNYIKLPIWWSISSMWLPYHIPRTYLKMMPVILKGRPLCWENVAKEGSHAQYLRALAADIHQGCGC